jgi:hypothetical protein
MSTALALVSIEIYLSTTDSVTALQMVTSREPPTLPAQTPFDLTKREGQPFSAVSFYHFYDQRITSILLEGLQAEDF